MLFDFCYTLNTLYLRLFCDVSSNFYTEKLKSRWLSDFINLLEGEKQSFIFGDGGGLKFISTLLGNTLSLITHSSSSSSLVC
jgi:hypothetical protein